MTDAKNEILLFLTDYWNDWEASYTVAVANSFSDYTIRTIGIDNAPKVSMGGIKAAIDCSISDFHNFESLSLIILPGGLSWEDKDYGEIADFVSKAREHQVPVAAICGSTLFLCRHGFLNNVKHTGDSLELFQGQEGYSGQPLYQTAQVVVDGGFITANETAAVEFAYEIFKILKIDTDEEMAIWYDNFKNGAIR